MPVRNHENDRINSLSYFRTILNSTLREIWREAYFRIWIVVSTLLFQGYYISCVLYEHLYVNHSAALGLNNTTFFFGNLPAFIFPILQVSAMVVALVAFDKYTRRPELHTRLCSNFTVLMGCAMSASVSVLIVVSLNVTAIFLSTFLASITDFAFGNVPSFIPAFNFLVIDLPPTLLFWASLSLFVALVIRNTPVAFALIFITAFTKWVLVLITPHDWLVMLSSYSYSTMIVSDLVPRLPDFEVLLSRATAIVAAIGCGVLAAYFWRRQDIKRFRYLLTGLMSLGTASIVLGALVWQVNTERVERQEWTDAHASYNPDNVPQLQSLTGNISIQPGDRLVLDLEMTLTPPFDFDVPELLFSFNPGMTIHRLKLNGIAQDFTFEHGVLSIERGCNPCSEDGNIFLSVEASGIPNVRFGYLEPEIEYIHSIGRFRQLRKLFGIHNAVFNKQFVALMPGIRWYPTPGLLSVDKHVEALVRAPDLFEVDLNVTLDEEDWIVTGLGQQPPHSSDGSSYILRPGHEINHFGILASAFKSKTTVVGDLTIEFLVHERHTETIDSLSELSDEFNDYLSQRLSSLAKLGIQFKTPAITLVEVPNDLRMVGGFGMEFVNSLPGLVLVKESLLPLSNVDDMKRGIRKYYASEEEFAPAFLAHLLMYEQENACGESLAESFAGQLHPYAYQKFNKDNLALNYLRRLSISISMAESSYDYVDADEIARFAQLMKANPITLLDNFYFDGSYSYHPLIIRNGFRHYLYLTEAVATAYSSSLRDLDTTKDMINGRRILHWKTKYLLFTLNEMFGEDTLHKIIRPLVDGDEPGASDLSIEYIYRAAAALDLDLGAFVREWLTTDGTPSFRSSPVETFNVSVAENDLQYQASFDIMNDSNTHGVVQFIVAKGFDYVTAGNPTEVPPYSSFRVNLYSTTPFSEVITTTFYSLNTAINHVVRSRSGEVTQRLIRPMLESSSWLPQDGEYIVVDNLDLGTRVQSNTTLRLSLTDGIVGLLDLVPQLPELTRNGVGYILPNAPSYQLQRWSYVSNFPYSS